MRIITGDCREALKTLADKSVNCCVTSPPYFGLRDYGTATWEGGDPNCNHEQGRKGTGRADGKIDDRGIRNLDGVGSMGGNCKKCGATRKDQQIGLEQTPADYVRGLVEVFREVRRVLRDDGTVWLNLGDSYNASGRHGQGTRAACKQGTNRASAAGQDVCRASDPGLKPKDLIGIPWRVALALQADGWYLRQDIIWAKTNPMPESVKDRCTKSHEYIFLLSKSPKYYFDSDAIKEPAIGGKDDASATFKRENSTRGVDGLCPAHPMATHRAGRDGTCYNGPTRNKRSVWTVSAKSYSGAHFATFPPDLIQPCVLAGCPVGGTVLDPFNGAGTTGLVSLQNGRDYIGCELNPEYVKLTLARLANPAGKTKKQAVKRTPEEKSQKKLW